MTIARSRVRHEQALAGFLVASLKLCAAAVMVQVGTVALDGTKLAGNAADKANRSQERLEAEVAEILRQAAEADQYEDAQHGDARGDALPDALASKAGRLARLRQGKARSAKRREPVEPAFGQIKEQQGARRFLRRGRRACNAEWKPLCGTHNLLKLWRHTVTPRAARPAIA